MGRTNTAFERIIIDADDAALPPVNPTSTPPSTSTTSAAAPVITDTQITPLVSRLKRTIPRSVRDDDPRYSATSHGRTRPAEHANTAPTDETCDPQTWRSRTPLARTSSRPSSKRRPTGSLVLRTPRSSVGLTLTKCSPSTRQHSIMYITAVTTTVKLVHSLPLPTGGEYLVVR